MTESRCDDHDGSCDVCRLERIADALERLVVLMEGQEARQVAVTRNETERARHRRGDW